MKHHTMQSSVFFFSISGVHGVEMDQFRLTAADTNPRRKAEGDFDPTAINRS